MYYIFNKNTGLERHPARRETVRRHLCMLEGCVEWLRGRKTPTMGVCMLEDWDDFEYAKTPAMGLLLCSKGVG